MTLSSFASRAAAVLSLAALAGCASDSPTGPNVDAGLAAALAESGVADLSNLSAAASIATAQGDTIPTITPPAPDLSRCTYSTEEQGFVCQPVVNTGVTFLLKYYLADENGVSQSAFNPATTDRLRAVLTANGSFSANGTAIAVHHGHDAQVVGLTSTTHTVNGTSFDHDTVTTGDVMWAGTVSGEAADVVLQTGNAYPTSGSLAWTVGVVRTQGVSSLSHTTYTNLAFNGTQFGTLSVVRPSGSYTCSVDLTGVTPATCN